LAGAMGANASYCPVYGPQYVLRKSDVKGFKKCWKITRKVKIDEISPLSVTIRRFNFAYNRTLPEDKLVDYAISYEALFSGKEDKESLNHKLALRFSRLHKRNFNDREFYFQKGKDLYNARSAIVHGDDRRKKNQLLKLTVEEVEEFIRTSIMLYIKKLILNNFNHDSILRHLDLD
jgi:hypothetical protein